MLIPWRHLLLTSKIGDMLQSEVDPKLYGWLIEWCANRHQLDPLYKNFALNHNPLKTFFRERVKLDRQNPVIGRLLEKVKERQKRKQFQRLFKKRQIQKTTNPYWRYRTLIADPILPNLPTFDWNNNNDENHNDINFLPPVPLSPPPPPLPALSGPSLFTQQNKIEQKQDEDLGSFSVVKKTKEKVVLSSELAQIPPAAGLGEQKYEMVKQ